jgi:succinyl-CoA synthetase alpha subunit
VGRSIPSVDTHQNVLVKHNYYRDSLELLRLSDEIKRYPGIMEASLVMGTKTNKDILIKLGFHINQIAKAESSDMIIALRAKDDGLLLATVSKIEAILRGTGGERTIELDHSSPNERFDLESVLGSVKDINIALISVPGEYVKDLAFKLIDEGIHQQIFSDHVPMDDELQIKRYAVKNHVLILGPGAGTSIINGNGIGFSNAVTAGPVAIVAAAGTGLQEVSTLLDHCGIGVRHGLGVGGNDPKANIGGLMMSEALKLLDDCEGIDVINIVSKPPSASVQQKIIDHATKHGKKKYVMTFIGGSETSKNIEGEKTKRAKRLTNQSKKITISNTLTSSVLATAKHIANMNSSELSVDPIYVSIEDLKGLVMTERKKITNEQKYLRALYTGGTFAYETQVILNGLAIGPLYSNAPLIKAQLLQDPMKSFKNSIIDLGEEEFTKGRAHPMIDPTIRKLRIVEEASYDDVAVIVLDFVLGYGSNSDPVGSIIDEIKKAKLMAAKAKRHLSVIAHVCGTRRDPQGYDRSLTRLQDAGVPVLPTNAFAAIAAAGITAKGHIDFREAYSRFIGEIPRGKLR